MVLLVVVVGIVTALYIGALTCGVWGAMRAWRRVSAALRVGPDGLSPLAALALTLAARAGEVAAERVVESLQASARSASSVDAPQTAIGGLGQLLGGGGGWGALAQLVIPALRGGGGNHTDSSGGGDHSTCWGRNSE